MRHDDYRAVAVRTVKVAVHDFVRSFPARPAPLVPPRAKTNGRAPAIMRPIRRLGCVVESDAARHLAAIEDVESLQERGGGELRRVARGGADHGLVDDGPNLPAEVDPGMDPVSLAPHVDGTSGTLDGGGSTRDASEGLPDGRLQALDLLLERLALLGDLGRDLLGFLLGVPEAGVVLEPVLSRLIAPLRAPIGASPGELRVWRMQHGLAV